MGMHSDEARAGIVLCVYCGSKKYAGIMNTVYDSRAPVTTQQRSLKIYLCNVRGFGYVHVECQSFCPKIVTVFMSAFKSTNQVHEGESDNGNKDQSSRIL